MARAKEFTVTIADRPGALGKCLTALALRQDPTDYSGHSFRRGGTTALLLAGVPEATIAAHGRWKSLAYRGYFDVQHSVRLRLAATAQLSLHSRRRTGSTPL